MGGRAMAGRAMRGRAMAFVLLSSESQLYLPVLPLLLPDLSSELLPLLLPLPLLVLSLPPPPLLDLSLLLLLLLLPVLLSVLLLLLLPMMSPLSPSHTSMLLLMTTLALPSMLERTRMPMAMCRDPTPSTFLMAGSRL